MCVRGLEGLRLALLCVSDSQPEMARAPQGVVASLAEQCYKVPFLTKLLCQVIFYIFF